MNYCPIRFGWVDMAAWAAQDLPAAFQDRDHLLTWAVSLDRGDLADTVFSDQELRTANRCYTLKRQLEWLSGRLAAKSLVAALGVVAPSPAAGPDLSAVEVVARPDGSPWLPQFPGIRISLSHAGRYAVCAARQDGGENLGVDVEKIQPTPPAELLEVGFTPEERQALFPPRPAEVYRHWTIKEAYLKYGRQGFNENLQNIEVWQGQIVDAGRRRPDLTVTSFSMWAGYVVSFVY